MCEIRAVIIKMKTFILGKSKNSTPLQVSLIIFAEYIPTNLDKTNLHDQVQSFPLRKNEKKNVLQLRLMQIWTFDTVTTQPKAAEKKTYLTC